MIERRKNIMNTFTYSYPVKVYFGEGAAKEHLAEAVADMERM